MFCKHNKKNVLIAFVVLTTFALVAVNSNVGGLDESPRVQQHFVEPKYDAVRRHLDVVEEEQSKGNNDSEPTKPLLVEKDICSDIHLIDGTSVPGCWSLNGSTRVFVCHTTICSNILNICFFKNESYFSR